MRLVYQYLSDNLTLGLANKQEGHDDPKLLKHVNYPEKTFITNPFWLLSSF
jgi:hypothetical protein